MSKAQPYESVIGCCDDCGAEGVSIYRSESGWTCVSCVLEEDDDGYTELHLEVALGVLAAERKRAQRAIRLLTRLIDAVAGEQEHPWELERALGKEAPPIIKETRAWLKGEDDADPSR